jgi:hypothetical protein
MPQAASEGRSTPSLHFRCAPPVLGGAQQTGWEALDKWVGGGGAAAPAAPSGKTGWESLDKWVGGGGAAAPAAASGTTGWEALDKWVGGGGAASASAAGTPAPQAAAPAAASTKPQGGGFMAALKRFFGG